ncbi:hypothetical protein [Cystobacter fuscus]|uniref:hypothetical protein n=1 Tax=Cystobacter fuscus TaxID=43 RepID=UPI0012DCB69B|nr:hypothetical protein [Cystobacter fuscus]
MKRMFLTTGSRARVAALFLVTLVGIALGIWGDFWRGDVDIPLRDVVASIVLSPWVVTFGGDAVARSGYSHFFFFCGLLFWPVYAILARLWLKRGQLLVLVVICLWCFQGFFLVVHRFYRISSV